MSAMSLEALQDLFLLYSNEGRKDKVVLGLTDTMYKKRLSTVGNIDSLSKAGFRSMMEQAPGLLDGLTIQIDYIFMSNLGYTDPRKPKYELNFDQFLDAVAAVAVARYPRLDHTRAVHEVLRVHLRPLFISRFGEEPPTSEGGSLEEGGEGDNGTVVTSRTTGTTSRTSTRRKSRVVLTSDGIVAASAMTGGPRVPLMVDQTTEVALLSGATTVNPSGGSSIIGGGGPPATVKRRMSMRLGGAGGSSPVGGGGGGSPASSPRSQSVGPRKPVAQASPAAPTAVAFQPPPSAAAGAGTGGAFAPPARGGVPSMFSVNPFSPEAREPTLVPAADAGYGGGHAASPVSLPRSLSPAAAVAGPQGSSSSPAQHAELRGMVSRLVAVVDQLRGEVQRLRDENTELRAQVGILKGGGGAR